VGIRVVVDVHRPELIAQEGLAQESYSLLFEEDGACGVQTDEDAEDGK
jgi:hypothetical protein